MARTAKEVKKKQVKEEVKAKKGKKVKEKIVKEKVKVFSPHADIDNVLDGIEKDYHLASSSMDKNEKRLSTGILEIDRVLGKGVVPGAWYTVLGQEQSAKSTLVSTITTAALNSEVPILASWDYEGSTSPEYLENMMKVNGIKASVEEIFGIKDTKGNWVIKPRVRYYSEAIGEKFFDYLAKLQRKLPDKLKMADQWYYVYEDNKVNKAKVGDNYDVDYYKKHKRFRIPAPDGNMQALILLDSYPAMLPENMDVDDPNSAIASQARMFSEQLKRVKGRLRAKKITVLGVNQLRDKPMVMFGSPEYEPCGNALKLFSDARLRMTPRAIPNGKGQFEEEDSAFGEGTDVYRYIHVRAIKNKLSTPNLEGWLRIWVRDKYGKARGFCPVWDTYQYLINTGQIQGNLGTKTKLKLAIKGKDVTKVFKWADFKAMILGNSKTAGPVMTKIGFSKYFSIRDFCKHQLAEGNGMDLFFETKKNTNTKEKASKKDD